MEENVQLMQNPRLSINEFITTVFDCIQCGSLISKKRKIYIGSLH